jgi:hypothetical protein
VPQYSRLPLKSGRWVDIKRLKQKHARQNLCSSLLGFFSSFFFSARLVVNPMWVCRGRQACTHEQNNKRKNNTLILIDKQHLFQHARCVVFDATVLSRRPPPPPPTCPINPNPSSLSLFLRLLAVDDSAIFAHFPHSAS